MINFIKKVMPDALKTARRIYSAQTQWFAGLTFIKITAIVVVNCFLLTGVYGQSAAAIFENAREREQFNELAGEFMLPYSYGVVTDARYCGSETAIINIQDLHSHAQVQKNISNIIKIFDSKYGVKNIYLEGAYGQVDTSWIGSIKNDELKETLLESLLKNGSLTGAEYYSVKEKKERIIKGLEEKDQYLGNLKRFADLLYAQDEINPLLLSIDEDIAALKKTYFNRRQAKIEELSKKYAQEQINSKKYYALMAKYADRLGIDMEKYKNIDLYTQLLEEGEKIQYEKVKHELQIFITKLKEILPYGTYKSIMQATDNFTEIDKLYACLTKLSKEKKIDVSYDLPELDRFFDYLEHSKNFNPTEMITEEQKLIDEMNGEYAVSLSEKEAIFLVSFSRYLKNYLNGKITSDDYKYYKANVGKFKDLWGKYIDNKKLEVLTEYEKNTDDFYDVNVYRNSSFIANIEGLNDKKIKTTDDLSSLSDTEKIIKTLNECKNVNVVVTGGFHTQDVSKLLADKNITYIVITPNAAGDASLAEEAYHRIAKEQSKILFQTLAALNLSEAPLAYKLFTTAASLASYGRVSQEFFDKEVNPILQEIINNSGKKNIMTAELVYGESGTIKLEFAENGQKKTYSYNAETKEFVNSAESADTKTRTKRTVNFTVSGIAAVAAAIFGALLINPLIGLIVLPGFVSLLKAYGLENAKKELAAIGLQKALIKNSFGEEGDNIGDLPAIVAKQYRDASGYAGDENVVFEFNGAKAQKGILAEFNKEDGKVHVYIDLLMYEYDINPRTKQMSTRGVLAFRNLVNHELRHKKIAASKSVLARFIQKHSLLEEIIVASADYPDLIALYAANIASNIGSFTKSRPKLLTFTKLADVSRTVMFAVIMAMLAVQGIFPNKGFAQQVQTGIIQQMVNPSLVPSIGDIYYAWWQWPSVEPTGVPYGSSEQKVNLPSGLQNLHNSLTAFQRARLGYNNNTVTPAYVKNLQKLSDSAKTLSEKERNEIFAQSQYNASTLQSAYNEINSLFADESYWRAYRAFRGLGANADRSRAAVNAMFDSNGNIISVAGLRGELNKIIVNGYEEVFKEFDKFYNFLKSESPADKKYLDEIRKVFPYDRNDDAKILGIIWNHLLFDGDESLTPRAFLDKHLPVLKNLFTQLAVEEPHRKFDYLYQQFNLGDNQRTQRDYNEAYKRSLLSDGLLFYPLGGKLNTVEALKAAKERGTPYYSKIYINGTPYDDLVLNAVLFKSLDLSANMANPSYDKTGAGSSFMKSSLTYGDLLSLFFSGAVEHEEVVAGLFNETEYLGNAKPEDGYSLSRGVSPYRQIPGSTFTAKKEQQIMINTLTRNIVFDNNGRPNARYAKFYLQDANGRWQVVPSMANAFYSLTLADINKDVKAMFDLVMTQTQDGKWTLNKDLLGRINSYLARNPLSARLHDGYGNTTVVANAKIGLNQDGLLDKASMSVLYQLLHDKNGNLKDPSAVRASLSGYASSQVPVNALPKDVRAYKFDVDASLKGIFSRLRDRLNVHSEIGRMAGIRADVYQIDAYERNSYISGEKTDFTLSKSMGDFYAEYNTLWYYKLASNQLLDEKGNIRKQYAQFFKYMPGNDRQYYVDPAKAEAFIKLVIESIEKDIKATALLVSDTDGYRDIKLNNDIVKVINSKIVESWKTSKPIYIPVYNNLGVETGRRYVTINPIEGRLLNDDALYLLSLFVYNENGTIKSDSQIRRLKYDLLNEADAVKYPGMPFANMNDDAVRDLSGLSLGIRLDSPYIKAEDAVSVQAAIDKTAPVRKVAGNETIVSQVVLRDDYKGGKILVYERAHYTGKGAEQKQLYTEQFIYVGSNTGAGNDFNNQFVKTVVSVTDLERIIKAEYLRPGSNLRKYMDALAFFSSEKFLDAKGNVTAAGLTFLNNLKYSDRKLADGNNIEFTKTQIVEGLFGNADKWEIMKGLKSYGLQIGELDPSRSAVSQKAADVLSTLDKEGLVKIIEFMDLLRNTKVGNVELAQVMNSYYPELKNSPLPAKSAGRHILTESNIKFLTKFLWPKGTGTEGVAAITAAETTASLFADPDKGVFIPVADIDRQFASFQNILIDNLRNNKVLSGKSLNDMYNAHAGANLYSPVKDADGVVTGRYKTEVAEVRRDASGNQIIKFVRTYETETGSNEFSKVGEEVFISIITPEQQKGVSSDQKIPVLFPVYLETLEKKIGDSLNSVQLEGLDIFENDLRIKLVAGQAAELKDAFGKGASEYNLNLTQYTDEAGKIVLPSAVITRNSDGTYNVRVISKNQAGREVSQLASGKLTFRENVYGILAADPAYITSNPDSRSPVVFIDANGKYILKPREKVVQSVEIVDGAARAVIRYTDASGKSYIMSRVYSDESLIKASERELINRNSANIAGQTIPLAREAVGDIKIGSDMFSFDGVKIVINSKAYTLDEIKSDASLSSKWDSLQKWLDSNSLIRLSDGNIYANSGVSIGTPNSQITKEPYVITVEEAQKQSGALITVKGTVYGGQIVMGDVPAVKLSEALYSVERYMHAGFNDMHNAGAGFNYSEILNTILPKKVAENLNFDINDLNWVKKVNLKTGAAEWTAYSAKSSMPVISVKSGVISVIEYKSVTDKDGNVITAPDNVMMYTISHGYTEKALSFTERIGNFFNNLFNKEDSSQLNKPAVEFDGTTKPVEVFNNDKWHKMIDVLYSSSVNVDGKQVPLVHFMNERFEELEKNKLPETKDGLITASNAEFLTSLLMRVAHDKDNNAIAVDNKGNEIIVTDGLPEGFTYKIVPSKWATDPQSAAAEFGIFDLWQKFTAENILGDINSIFTYFDYEQQKEVPMNISPYSSTAKLSKSDLQQLFQFIPKQMVGFDAAKVAENVKREIRVVKYIRSYEVVNTRIALPGWLSWLDNFDKNYLKGRVFGIDMSGANIIRITYDGIDIPQSGPVPQKARENLRRILYKSDGSYSYVMEESLLKVLGKPALEMGPEKLLKEAVHTRITKSFIFFMAPFIALYILLKMFGSALNFFKRRIKRQIYDRRNLNGASAGDIERQLTVYGESMGAKGPKNIDAGKIAQQLLLLRLTNEGMPIKFDLYGYGDMSSGASREEMLEYFSLIFNGEEAGFITDALMNNRLTIGIAERRETAVNMREISDALGSQNADDIIKELPLSGNYADNDSLKAVNALLANMNLSNRDISALLKSAKDSSDSRWLESLKKVLLREYDKKVYELLRDSSSEEEFKDALWNALPSRQIILMRNLYNKGIIYDRTDFKKLKANTLNEAVDAVAERIVRDTFKSVSGYLPGIYNNADARGLLFNTPDNKGSLLTEELILKIARETAVNLLNNPYSISQTEDVVPYVAVDGYSLQMSASDLKEYILMQLVGLPVSFTKGDSLGPNASLKPGAVYLVRKMIQVMDRNAADGRYEGLSADQIAAAKKKEITTMIQQLKDFSIATALFSTEIKFGVTENTGKDRGKLEDRFIDFNYLYMFALLTSDYDTESEMQTVNTRKYASGYNIFALTKEQQQAGAFSDIIEKIKSEDKTGEIIKNSTDKNGEINIIKAIDEYIVYKILEFEKKDDIAKAGDEKTGDILKEEYAKRVHAEAAGYLSNTAAGEIIASYPEVKQSDIDSFKAGDISLIETLLQNGTFRDFIDSKVRSAVLMKYKNDPKGDFFRGLAEGVGKALYKDVNRLAYLVNEKEGMENKEYIESKSLVSESAFSEQGWFKSLFPLKVQNFLKTVYKRYLRYFVPFKGLEKFWNITTKEQKTAFWVYTGVFAILAVLAVFALPLVTPMIGAAGVILEVFSTNIAITFITMALLMPKIIVGQSDSKDMKKSIGFVTAVFSIYWGGFLGAFFLRGISISLFTSLLGPVTIALSAAVWIGISISTYISLWNLMMGARGNAIEKKSNKLKTYQEVEKKVSNQKVGALLIAASVLSFLGMASGVGLLIIPVLLFVAGAGLLVRASFMKGSYNKPAGFKRTAESFAREYFEQDKHKSVIEYQSFKTYMLENIENMHNEFFLSKDEYDKWKKFIETEGKEGELVMPKDRKARQITISFFNALGVEKTPIKDFASMAPVTQHVQSYTEVSGWPVFKLFDRNKAVFSSKSTLLGYILNRADTRWANAREQVMEKRNNGITGAIKNKIEQNNKDIAGGVEAASREKENEQLNAILEKGIDVYVKELEAANQESLKNIKSGDIDGYALALQKSMGFDSGFIADMIKIQKFSADISSMETFSTSPIVKTLDTEAARELYNGMMEMLEAFSDSVLGSQKSVFKSMSDEKAEMHKKLAYEKGDMEYVELVSKMNLKYGSLVMAEREVGKKIAGNTADNDEKKWFEKYTEIYKTPVDLKNKLMFTDAALWSKFKPKKAGNTDYFEVNPLVAFYNNLKKLQAANPDEANLTKLLKDFERTFSPDEKGNLKPINHVEALKEFNRIKRENYLEINSILFNGSLELAQKVKETKDGKETEVNVFNDLKTSLYDLIYVMDNILSADKYGVDLTFYEQPVDELGPRGNKNGQLGMSMFKFTGVLIERDALCSTAIGHAAFSLNAVSYFDSLAGDGCLYVNFPMIAKGSNVLDSEGRPLYPIGESYGGAVADWTGPVLNAYSGEAADSVTLGRKKRELGRGQYYGKGILKGTGEGAITWTNPAEDSIAYMLNKFLRSMGRQIKNKIIFSSSILYFLVEWVRMTTTGLSGTEGRYSSNVTRMLIDWVSRVYDKAGAAGFDWKLSNIVMALHYANSLITAMFVLFIPILVTFSSYAFLMPFVVSVVLSNVLMLAINYTRVIHEVREQGSFFGGMKKVLKNLVLYFPFWGSLQPVILALGVNASNEIFKFINTQKEMLLSDKPVKEKYDFVNHLAAKFGFMGYIAAGMYVALLIGLTLINPILFAESGLSLSISGIFEAVTVSVVYILAAVSWVNGANAYSTFLSDDGKNYRTSMIWDKVYKHGFLAVLKAPFVMASFLRDFYRVTSKKPLEALHLKRRMAAYNMESAAYNYKDIHLSDVADLYNGNKAGDIWLKDMFIAKISDAELTKEFVKANSKLLGRAKISSDDFNKDKVAGLLDKKGRTPAENILLMHYTAFIFNSIVNSIEVQSLGNKEIVKEIIQNSETANGDKVKDSIKDDSPFASFVKSALKKDLKYGLYGFGLGEGLSDKDKIKVTVKALIDSRFETEIDNSFQYSLLRAYEQILEKSKEYFSAHPKFRLGIFVFLDLLFAGMVLGIVSNFAFGMYGISLPLAAKLLITGVGTLFWPVMNMLSGPFGIISGAVKNVLNTVKNTVSGLPGLMKFTLTLVHSADINDLIADKRDNAKGIRMFVVESFFDENGELTKEGALAKSRAGEFKKRGYTAVIVERAQQKPTVYADRDGVYKNKRVNPNAKFTVDGAKITNEHYLTKVDDIPLIQVFTKEGNMRTPEAFIEGVSVLAAHLNGDRTVSEESFGASGVSMINVIGFGNVVISEAVKNTLPGVYVSRTYMPEDVQNVKNEESIAAEKNRKIYPVEDSIADIYNVDAVNEAVEAEALYKLDEPLVFFHGDVSNMLSKEKMQTHILNKRALGANALILNVGGKVSYRDGKAVISDSLKESIVEARLKGLKVSVVLEMNDQNVNSEKDMAEFAAKVKALFENGFDGISIDAAGIKNADNMKKVLSALKDLSDKHAIKAVNTVHVSAEMKESVADDVGQYNIILIAEFTAAGELKILSDPKKRTAERKGYERGRKTADRNMDIKVKDIYALKGILTSENVSAADIGKALKESALDSEVGEHIRMLLAKDTPESVAQARGFIKGVIETLLERRYLEARGIDHKEYRKNANADKDAVGALLAAVFVSDIGQAEGIFNSDTASKEKFKAFLNAIKEYDVTGGKQMSVNEVRESFNPFINGLIGDSDSRVNTLKNNEIATALNALSVLDLVINKNMDKLINSMRNGTNTSTEAIRSMLSAA